MQEKFPVICYPSVVWGLVSDSCRSLNCFLLFDSPSVGLNLVGVIFIVVTVSIVLAWEFASTL
jgi:hypothetical protein